ncbi:MAG TPA: hypothetical protein VLH19_00490 [Patescibacteria group bacterium]|nr:hypothetical protein [Patescibacteria group bacterium]
MSSEERVNFIIAAKYKINGKEHVSTFPVEARKAVDAKDAVRSDLERKYGKGSVLSLGAVRG